MHPKLARGKLEARLGTFEPDIGSLDPGCEASRHAVDLHLANLRRKRKEEADRLHLWGLAKVASLKKLTQEILRGDRSLDAPTLLFPAQMSGTERFRSPCGAFDVRYDDWATTYLDENGAAARWGRVKTTGSDAFLRLVKEHAEVLNIPLVAELSRDAAPSKRMGRMHPPRRSMRRNSSQH